MDAMSTHSKKILRKRLKASRLALSQSLRETYSSRICGQLQTLETYINANHIALYHAMQGEVDLQTLWDSALKEGKTCYFPVLNDEVTLSFLPADRTTPQTVNQFGIQEPLPQPELVRTADELDMMLLPLLGFDPNGNRIGMGAGYYDRTLTKKRPKLLVGVGYEFQKLASIPADEWDIPLDGVVTEQAIYWRNK